MTPEEKERDFCTREWSRVHKDKSESVVDWLMDLRQLVRVENAVHLSVLQTENERLKRALELQENETRLAREQAAELQARIDGVIAWVDAQR